VNSEPVNAYEYTLWKDLIRQRIGLQIRENQLDFLSRRLRERMHSLSMRNYLEYYNFLTKGDRNQHEWQELVELLVNWESGFLRHMPSYTALMDRVFPEFEKERLERGDNLLLMWSAGCSRGQEAYSLAMCVDHVFGGKGNCELRITGTDISRNALKRAQKGEYSFFEIRDMPKSFRDRYMTQTGMLDNIGYTEVKDNTTLARQRPQYSVKESIRKDVNFGFLNLNNPADCWVSIQDVIFCQNVLIYFSVQDRARIILMLLKALRPGGYLFLAPGEGVGVKVEGAAVERFKDTLAYKRNSREVVHVRVAR